MRRHIGSPPVTYGLIITNVVVFLLELNAPDLDAFIFQYALVPARISFSNFFSFMPFVTSQFLHGGGLVHLLRCSFFYFFSFPELPLVIFSGALIYFSGAYEEITSYLLLMEGGEEQWRLPLRILRVRHIIFIVRM